MDLAAAAAGIRATRKSLLWPGPDASGAAGGRGPERPRGKHRTTTRPSCCDSCSTVVSLPVPTCALQKKRANALLHMEEYAMTNNDDGSYRLLSRPP